MYTGQSLHRCRLCYTAPNPCECIFTPHTEMSTPCWPCRSLHYTCHATLQAASNFKDVLQELLPAEQEPKPTPPKADTIPQTPKDSSEKQDAKQPPRASSTAKATTPKRQDQVTTKAAASRPSDKGRQERDRAPAGRHDPVRHHHQVRPCTTSLQCVTVVPVCLEASPKHFGRHPGFTLKIDIQDDTTACVFLCPFAGCFDKGLCRSSTGRHAPKTGG